MKQVLIRRGQIVVDDVPAPKVEPGTVLVRVSHSCISTGTEMSGIRSSAIPLWKRAVRQPAKARQVVSMVRDQGLAVTRSMIEAKVAAGEPTGYSAAGTVVASGVDIVDLRPGDSVACAGAQSAHHAEVIRVPRNLAVPVPDGVSMPDASTVTLGAIALQGVRRASPTLGETFVVIGLGIIGQLTAQLLGAAGCRVIGMDLDAARVKLALELGMEVGLEPDGDPAQVQRLTDGVGADGVVITAATSSNAVISTAFRMCRKKGRVILVGDVGLALDRTDFYEKELDFFISSSYGPGRYDRRYEEDGADYPIGYVRWTENRNMAEYLRQVAEGAVRVSPLVGASFPIADAAHAYASLSIPGTRSLVVLLDYPGRDVGAIDSLVVNPVARPGRKGAVRVALVGAGAFAKAMHLPNLQALQDTYAIQAVCSRTGHNATAAARQFGAAYATTDVKRVLDDPGVDLVVVATRHHLHAELALAALERGKHVLVEKPLALTQAELDAIVSFFERTSDPPILMTGFNRRFSAHAARLREHLVRRSGPMVISYRMNAGYMPADHWVHGREGGGRNRGEACHIYDLFTFLADARVEEIQATSIRPGSAHYRSDDNFVATMRFDEGSVAALTYTALGSAGHDKEQMDVYADGRVFSLADYRQLAMTVSSRTPLVSASDKGQRTELEQLGAAIRGGGEWPIPLWQQVQATEIALRVEELLRGSG